MTTDFFPPIVDDAYTFGQIAAANALSDIYAMGGKPMIALNIACFPSNLPPSLLSEILLGGQDKIREAGALIIGGHTVKDNELKYGLAVTGRILIKDIKTNSNAKVGDQIIFTKPIGTGIISTALKRSKADDADVEFIMKQMAELNRIPAEIMVKHNANAATDVTGFSLLGHLSELAEASGISIRLNSKEIPLIQNALRYSKEGFIPGGLNDNRFTFQDNVKLEHEFPEEYINVLYDPQTSGGLIITAPPDKTALMLDEIRSAGLKAAAVIGEVIEKREHYIEVY